MEETTSDQLALRRYDAAFTTVQNIVDMPDRDISLMVRLCLQN